MAPILSIGLLSKKRWVFKPSINVCLTYYYASIHRTYHQLRMYLIEVVVVVVVRLIQIAYRVAFGTVLHFLNFISMDEARSSLRSVTMMVSVSSFFLF